MFVYQQRHDKIKTFTVEMEGKSYSCKGNLIRWNFLMHLYKHKIKNIPHKKELILNAIKTIPHDELLSEIVHLTDLYFFNNMLSKLDILKGVEFQFGKLPTGVAGSMRVNMHRIVITVNYPQLKRYQTKFEESRAQSYSFERCTSLNCAIASNVRHELIHLISYCCTVMTNNKPLVEIDENPPHNKFFRKILFNCFLDRNTYHTFEEYNYKST